MSRGGRRTGTAGKRYPNRSDLRQPGSALPVQAAQGQTYGAAKAQMDAQRAIPLTTPGVTAQGGPASYPLPGSLGDPLRPTERPGEPLTSGIPIGPGPGPEVLPQPADAVADRIRAVYLAFPTQDLAEILEDLDTGASF